MMNNALIGHTGFVGGTLAGQRPFSATFNSHNIKEIRGCHFDQVVCAGVPAVKWLANREPQRDWNGIRGLIDCLKEVSAGCFVLISTIDVYREPVGLNENDAPSTDGLHPYGLHRLRLEHIVAELFPEHAIVRLPGLFGTGLKKNAIYDLMHLNQTEKIPPNASLQWYPTRRLANDLDRIFEAGIRLINVTAEPIAMETIRNRFFAGVTIGPPAASPPTYDLRSKFAALLGGRDGYHLTAAQVFDEMAAFIVDPEAVP